MFPVQAHCQVHDMEAGIDYRKLAQHRRGMYFTGSPAAHACMACAESCSLQLSEPVQTRPMVDSSARVRPCVFRWKPAERLCGQVIMPAARQPTWRCAIKGSSRSPALRGADQKGFGEAVDDEGSNEVCCP